MFFSLSRVHLRCTMIGAGLFSVGLCQSAYATTIDFEDHTGPSLFANVATPGAQTIVEGIATFSGGVILTNTTFLPADETSVYGTADFANSFPQNTNPVTNPLTITFSSAVQNFSLDVLNGNSVPVDYTVADNAGNSKTFLVSPNGSSGAQVFGFAAIGTVITISAGPEIGGVPWDFFIDNVTFDDPMPPAGADPPPPAGAPTATPLPGTLSLFAIGLGGLGLLGWRRKRKSRVSLLGVA